VIFHGKPSAPIGRTGQSELDHQWDPARNLLAGHCPDLAGSLLCGHIAAPSTFRAPPTLDPAAAYKRGLL